MAGAYVDKAHVQGLMEAKRIRIKKLASQIEDLTRSRETEISELAALQLMISPIGKLPTELLANIFHLVVPPELFWDESADNTEAVISEAHRVSQVCRHWRQIAHGTPQLWVDGFSFSANQKHTRLDLEQTEAWLKRSHPLPITVHFHCSDDGPADPGVAFKRTELFRTILSSTRRWRHVIWEIPYLCPLSDLRSGSFERLERVTIDNRIVETPPKAMDVFLTAPLLREVAICIRAIDRHTLELFRMPWWQLTVLTLEDDLLNDCHNIMLQCTNVRSMKIRSSWWDPVPGSSTSTVVVLPFLNALELHVDDLFPFGIGHFFACLALPSLKSLRLSFDNHLDTVVWDVGVFSEFQDRSPHIERIALTTRGRAISSEVLIALLRHSPHVTELTLDICDIDDIFLHALKVDRNDGQVVAPRLVKLTLDDIGDAPSDSAVEAMIRSRGWPDGDSAIPHRVSRLQKVVFSRSSYTGAGYSISQGLHARLKALQEQGLDIVLH